MPHDRFGYFVRLHGGGIGGFGTDHPKVRCCDLVIAAVVAPDGVPWADGVALLALLLRALLPAVVPR